MSTLPENHISEAQKLSPDAEVTLYELTPAGGGGTVRFKADNTVTWLGNEYLGVPLQFSGETHTADAGAPQPQLQIGDPSISLTAFKGLIHDGEIDGARLTKHTLLLDDLLNNRNIKVTQYYRVKRPDPYSSSSIVLILATFSPAGPTTLPFRQYLPPAFPFVRL